MDWRTILSSHALDRFRPAWIGISGQMLCIGLLFWLSTAFDVNSFSPETWGTWACQFPAKWWASIMTVSSAMIVTGLMRPVTARRVAIGSAIQVIQIGALAASAIFTGGQFVIGVYASVLLVPLHFVWLVQAVRYDPK